MNEIEEFLKRAAALRAQQQQRGSRQAGAPSAPAPAPVPAPVRTIAQPSPPVAEIVDAIVVDGGDTGDVSAHVQRQFQRLGGGSSPFGEQRLAERVRQADDVMEAHLHGKFEHRLGRLGAATSRAEDSTLDDEETAALAAASTTAAPVDFLQLLRNPHSLRTAIILSEVLTPPTERW
ncbi:MAG: hypothetical protein AB7F89_08105 [Pirellulaceae bacterium]